MNLYLTKLEYLSNDFMEGVLLPYQKNDENNNLFAFIALKPTKENDIIYYEQYAKMLLRADESIDNFPTLFQEFKDAYNKKNDVLNNLYNEIKIIKKLKV